MPEPEEEFEAFYRETSRSLLAQVHALTADPGEAQECLQEAYARAWQRWPAVAAMECPAAWVRVVALRLARSRWRRDRQLRLLHQLQVLDDVEGPGPDAVAVTAALRRLPEVQRRALVLHHLGDVPLAEVAAQTGVPVGTVKARLSRGRSALARLLEEGRAA